MTRENTTMSETISTTIEPSAKPTHYQIVVNGELTSVASETVTYEQVVAIAYPTPPAPDTRYTVTYRNAQHPHEGSLAPGGSVQVKKEGTVFNVRATNRS
jgi:Multiubiquitin